MTTQRIDDRSITIPFYEEGPDKSKLEDKELTTEQIEAMLAKLFEREQEKGAP